MKVEIIHSWDPFILLSPIQHSCQRSRIENEHDAGLHLLDYGMKELGFLNYELDITMKGKPFIKEAAGVPYFSISHSRTYAACAISSKEIGCDIERIRKVPERLNRELEKLKVLKIHFLSDNEMARRTQMWTIYEAVGKYNGDGIPVSKDTIKCENWVINSRIVDSSHIISWVYK